MRSKGYSDRHPKRRYLSEEELNGVRKPREADGGNPAPPADNPPVGTETGEDDTHQGVGGPLYTPSRGHGQRPDYEELACIAGTAPYDVQEMIAQGAESVLYRAAVGGQVYCVKSIRNFLGRRFARAAGRENNGKLEDVSYATKVRHLRNEFDVGRHLYEAGEIPVVAIYALRKMRRFGVEIGYDLLLEYISGHDMGDKRFTAGMSVEDKINVLYQTLKALRFIHSKRYIHMDMKPSNIMVDANRRVKLIDFGVTVSKGYRPRSVTGTTGYLSPEQIVKDYLDEATDMFSLGITFAVIFGGNALRQSQDELKSKQFRSGARFHLDAVDQPAITHFPELAEFPELVECLSRCTIPKRGKRLEDVTPLIPFIERLAQKRGFPLDVTPE